LLFSGLSNKQVVVCLLKIKFGCALSIHGILKTSSEVRNQSIGVIKGGVGFLVGILSDGQLSLSSIIHLSSKVESVSGSIDHQIGLLLLVQSITEDLFGVFVSFEGKIVDILSIKSSSQSSFGILGSLTGLSLSIDENIVGFFKLLRSDVEFLLSSFKVILGKINNLSLVVDVSGG